MLANERTGLTSPSVFYFGNAIGEVGNSTNDTRVNLADIGFTRDNQTAFVAAEVDNPYDHNRDGRVNLGDIGISRDNQTAFRTLQLITAPDGSSGNDSSLQGDGGESDDGLVGGSGDSFARYDSNDEASDRVFLGPVFDFDLNAIATLAEPGIAEIGIGKFQRIRPEKSSTELQPFIDIENESPIEPLGPRYIEVVAEERRWQGQRRWQGPLQVSFDLFDLSFEEIEL